MKSSNFSKNRRVILNVWNPAWQMSPAKTLRWSVALRAERYGRSPRLRPLQKGVEVCLTKASAPPVTPVALAAQSSRVAFGKRDSKHSE